METDQHLLDRLHGDPAFERALASSRHLLVACSSGGDSLCLLDVMADVAPQRQIRLTVVHLDHGLRGAQSAAEAASVVAAAQRYSLPYVVDRAEIDASAGDLEARCRQARHDFFRRCCAEAGADGVALAHTLDDRAETVLMNLARGAGRRGLAGMRATSRVGGLRLVRPLLHLRRDELRRHLRHRGIAWHEDPMNEDARFTRVRMRRDVLPLLEAIVPGTAHNVARAAEILEVDEDWIESVVQERLREATSAEESAGGLALDATTLRRCHPGLQARLLRAAIARVRGVLTGIRREHVEAVLERVLGGAEQARDLPGVRVVLQGGLLRLLPLQGRVLATKGRQESDR